MDSKFSLAVEIVVLLGVEEAATLTSLEIAERLNTDPARVRQLFSLLGRAGIITARQKKGAWLAKPAEEISLGEIVSAVRSKGTLISLTRTVAPDRKRRALATVLRTHVVGAEAAFFDSLGAITLAQLIEESRSATDS